MRCGNHSLSKNVARKQRAQQTGTIAGVKDGKERSAGDALELSYKACVW